MKRHITWFGIAALAALGACGSEPALSKDPGSLGAPCDTKSDCDGALLCLADLHLMQDLSYCYVECGADGECPEGSACVEQIFLDAQGARVRKSLCERTCKDDAFCEDLHPDTDSCQAWNGKPVEQQTAADQPKYCGIRG